MNETEKTAADAAAPSLKKKELVDRVAATSGVKKKVAKDLVEAVLTVLGDALSRGEELNLPPLGRAKVSRQMERGTGEVLVIKLRRGGGKSETPEPPLAEAAE